MLQTLLHHVGRDDLTGFANCHVRGLNSIMLSDIEGNRIRLYVTSEDHDLYLNYLDTDTSIDEDLEDEEEDDDNYGSPLVYSATVYENHRALQGASMSLGLHRHATELRLEVLAGSISNITAEIVNHDSGRLYEYSYDSAITGGGSIAMQSANQHRLDNVQSQQLNHGDSVLLNSDVYHTVAASSWAAWMVYERGPRNPEHEGKFFSYNRNVVPPSEAMYTRLSNQECQVLLARVIGMYQREAERDARQKAQKAIQDARNESLNKAREAISNGARSVNVHNMRGILDQTLMHTATMGGAGAAVAAARQMMTNEDYQAWLNSIESPSLRNLSDTAFVDWMFHRFIRSGRIPTLTPDQVRASDNFYETFQRATRNNNPSPTATASPFMVTHNMMRGSASLESSVNRMMQQASSFLADPSSYVDPF